MNDPKPAHQAKARNRQSGSFLGLIVACLVLAVVIILHLVKVHQLDAQLADTQKQLADSKAETAKAQGELDKATAASTDLQQQLKSAKSQQADLQVKLDQSTAASTQLQAQLDKAKAQAVDQQAQLDKSKAQAADLQTQLSQANSGSAQLLTQLDQSKIQSMDLQSRLQKAESDLSQLQPILLKARHMPVTTSFEKAHFGRGFTLHINNLNPQPLSVDVRTDKPSSQSNVIAAGATLNMEKLDAGEKVVISSEGYEPVNLTVQ